MPRSAGQSAAIRHDRLSKRAPQPCPDQPTLASRKLVATGTAAIALLTFVAYYPCLHGDFILDDHVLITDSRLTKDEGGLYGIWFTTDAIDYWPLTNSSFWLEWRLWGNNTTGYHVSNLVLHILTALLIWRLLSTLGVPGAFLAGLLFAVHPVNVESVAWITQRKNLLALLFLLVSVRCYVNAERQAPRRLGRWYWLGLGSFLLAMLSKASAAILPVLLLAVVWWLRPLAKRDFIRVVPFFLIAIPLTAVTMWFQSRFAPTMPPTDLIERLLRAAAATLFYLGKALLPLDLAFIYPLWRVDVGEVRWWLPLVASLGVTVVAWSYRRTWSRPLLFGWGCFCVALVPVMGLTDVSFMEHSLVADHYQHMALIAVMALLGAGWATWRGRLSGPLDAAAIAVVVAFTCLSWQQSSLYVDGMTLFRRTLEQNPRSAFAENNLGLVLRDAGRMEEAKAHWQQALRLRPDYPESHYNMGRALFDAGDFGGAIQHFREALRLRPNLPDCYFNLGTALARSGQTTEAIERLRQAIHLKPDYAEPHHNLGSILLEAGRAEEAVEQFERTLRLNPQFPDAHYNLGLSLYRLGRLPEAIEQFRQELRLKPESAAVYNALGVAFSDSGRRTDAIEQFQQALRVNPGDPVAAANLAEVTAADERGSSPAKKAEIIVR